MVTILVAWVTAKSSAPYFFLFIGTFILDIMIILLIGALNGLTLTEITNG